MAGSSITFVHQKNGPVKAIIATCTGDDADGSYPATALPSFSGRLLGVQTNPTTLTTLWDLTLADQDGLDRMQGVGANRHATASEYETVIVGALSDHPPVAMSDVLTLTPVNNSVNDAVVVITFYYEGQAEA